MSAFGYHPVLGMHQSAQMGNYQRHGTDDAGDVFEDLRGAIDNTPRIVAGIALGALITLFMLKKAGFRFAVGVNVGR